MTHPIIQEMEKSLMRAIPSFKIGDTVEVRMKVKEGDKERIQVYAGTVIARAGGGATETFTVRRISYGEGVERVFPVHAPSVARIEVERAGKARRAKLYYLRGRTGKTGRIEEQAEQRAAQPEA